MKKKYAILLIVLIFIISIILIIYNQKPGSFKINYFNQDINKKENLNYLSWTNSKKAKKYIVNILNKNNEIIDSFETLDNKILLNNINISQNQDIIFEIEAVSKNKKKRITKQSYTWLLPTINVSNELVVLKTIEELTDIDIKINNENNLNNLYLQITKDNKELYNGSDINIKLNNYLNNIDNLFGSYDIILYYNQNNEKVVLNKKSVNINLPDITPITLTSPYNNSEIPYQDYMIEFAGGKNADIFAVNIIDEDNNIIIDNIETKDKNILLKKEKIKENTEYYIKITAINTMESDKKKEVTYSFKTAKDNKVSSILSTKPSGEIGIKRPIRLKTFTSETTIYYTIDGSTPTCNSTEYKGNINITKDMTIKAIACYNEINTLMENSDILELNYKTVSKQKAIYLSPSNQINNLGIGEVGFTTEMEIMNKISDYTEKKLKENNIIVYRNSSDMNLSEMVIDSSKYDVDLHLAIHSNALDGTNRGVETWVHDGNWKQQNKLAELIQNYLMKIYPVSRFDRGTKYSTWIGGLRETNPMNTTNGVLVEVAFHDNYEDALWIMNNLESIGNTIAEAVIEYLK